MVGKPRPVLNTPTRQCRYGNVLEPDVNLVQDVKVPSPLGQARIEVHLKAVWTALESHSLEPVCNAVGRWQTCAVGLDAYYRPKRDAIWQ